MTGTIAKLTVPGAVWLDALDPLASGMQEALDLPEPRSRRIGKGWQYVYENVPVKVALELAEYLYDRGEMLVGQDDPSVAHVHRSAMKTAQKIREEAGR